MQAKVDLHWRHEEQALRKFLYGSLQTFGILAVLLLDVSRPARLTQNAAVPSPDGIPLLVSQVQQKTGAAVNSDTMSKPSAL
jgi:hypothetical protein